MSGGCLIVLINYKSAGYTVSCLKSLERISYKNFVVYLIDNNSGKEDIKELSRYLETSPLRVELVLNSENVGFAKAANMGMRHAIKEGFDYVLLLNNDTLVEPDFLEKLIETAESEERVGIVSGKVLFRDGRRIFSLGGSISFLRNIGHLHYYRRPVHEASHIERDFYCTFVSGCLMLIKVELLKDVGLLDEDFFMYIEDVDFCYRALKRDWKIKVNPKAVIYHAEGASSTSEFAAYWASLNRLRFLHKNFKGLDRALKVFAYMLTRPLYYLRIRDLKVIKADIKGAVDFYRSV